MVKGMAKQYGFDFNVLWNILLLEYQIFILQGMGFDIFQLIFFGGCVEFKIFYEGVIVWLMCCFKDSVEDYKVV